MTLQTAILGATVWLIAQHPAMPPGTSHDQHMKQMADDEALKKRGAFAMGFDQDATTHHFRIEPMGGSIEVTVKNAADAATLARVRTHLKSIAEAFARGDFGKPVETHAEVPSGVAVMMTSARLISYTYEELPLGGAVRIRTADSRALRSVHDFLRYQISAHHTGDPQVR